jgi:hypothetical protein
MLIAIDAVYPPDAILLAEQLGEPLVEQLGKAVEVYEHVPLPPEDGRVYPMPMRDPKASLLYAAARIAECMAKIEREDFAKLHLIAGWHDTVMGMIGEGSVQKWHDILEYASRTPTQMGIQLYHVRPETEKFIYGTDFGDRVEQLQRIFYARTKLPERYPTLILNERVLTEDDEVMPDIPYRVAEFIRQHFPGAR